MKRKIAAIMAADIAGYSKLVAEDEEETLRRLGSYRGVFEDFVSRFSGRVFNIAGDAVLAEFPSSVEAVRCAIDVQESVRTRNLAYPASRQMSFRIGITIGDVVERDGDLLGDGVNIAARLEGLAAPGGVCVSRSVYEQVANKLSVGFIDIGEQAVKNLPNPIHAYSLALGGIEGRVVGASRKGAKSMARMWPGVAAVAGVAAALLYSTWPRTSAPVAVDAPVQIATEEPAVPAPPPRPPERQAEPLVPEAVPFIPDRQRAAIRDAYMSAPDHKAIAISFLQAGFITDQKDDDTAKAAAVEQCQRASDALILGQHCELYAVGTTVVSTRGRPPMPPEPWLVRDASIETPFVVKEVPLLRDGPRPNMERYLHTARPHKALALSPQGLFGIYRAQSTVEEAVRRSLEHCGARAGLACRIVAVDDVFVVPIPTVMKAVSLFHASGTEAIAPQLREAVAHRIGNVTTGWSAVAVGTSGRAGLALGAANEQSAIDGALTDCGKQDRGCRVIAIGPFLVAPR